MFTKIWLINIGLAVFFIFFGIKALDVWTKEALTPLEIKTVKAAATSMEDIRTVKNSVLSELVYESVASQNLFSPERTEPRTEEPEQEKESEEKKPVDKPPKISGREISLYGVIIMEGYVSALISNPKPESGERNSKWVKVGDLIGDFEVKEIKEESVVLIEGNERYEIKLFDEAKARKAAPSSKAAAKEIKPTVIDTSTKEKSKVQVIDDKAKVRPRIDKKDDKEGTPKGVHEWKPKPGEKYKVIDTPFGKVKVRDKD